jgi:hypothetical protein
MRFRKVVVSIMIVFMSIMIVVVIIVMDMLICNLMRVGVFVGRSVHLRVQRMSVFRTATSAVIYVVMVQHIRLQWLVGLIVNVAASVTVTKSRRFPRESSQ